MRGLGGQHDANRAAAFMVMENNIMSATFLLDCQDLRVENGADRGRAASSSPQMAHAWTPSCMQSPGGLNDDLTSPATVQYRRLARRIRHAGAIAGVILAAGVVVPTTPAPMQPNAMHAGRLVGPIARLSQVGYGSAAHAAYRDPQRGSRGAVAADHELASRAGAEVLARGGNAVDAAIATALALGVVQPAGSGLGGGGFLVFRRSDGTVRVLDFREVAPKAARPDMFVDAKTGEAVPERSRHGGLAIGVPGEAAGFATALRELGSLPADQVVAPALRLARDGFPVGRHLARSAANVVPKLRAGHPLRAILAPGGAPLSPGELWRRPELGTTLATLGRDGFAAFYRLDPGAIGDEIVRATAAEGGVLVAEDLRQYKPAWRNALSGRYRGWQVITAPPPAGGITALETLQILNARPPLRDGPGASSTLHEIVESFKHAFADRARYHGDPAFDKVPTEELSSAAYAAGRAATIRPDRVLPAAEYGRPTGGTPLQAPRDHGTTHLCVIDKDGNAAALTTTVNLSFGAHVIAGRTGVLLNNQMDDFAAQSNRPNAFGLVGTGANSVAAGKRPASSMTPLIAVAPDGTVLCVGGSGGPTIVTGVVQTVINVVDFHMPIEAAIASPRVHAQYIPNSVLVEPEVPADVRTALQARGHKLIVTPAALETAVQGVLWRPPASRPQPEVTTPIPVADDRAAEPRGFSAASDPRKGGVPALP